MVEKLVTHLEMAAPERLRPAAPVDGFALERVDDPAGEDAGRIRRLHDAIATPHHWSSLGRSEEGWQRYLGEPRFTHWIATVHGEDVGWASLVSEDAAVEIGSFGLLPDVGGRGYGGRFLTELVRAAWQIRPAEGRGRPDRVWLHTSSWDHPRAIANYLSRGFTVVRRELQDQHSPFDRDRSPVDGAPRFLVRPAVELDAAAVGSLISDLGYELASEIVERRLVTFSASADDIVAVAVEASDQVVGVVSAHIVPMFAERAPAFVRITALVVAPDRSRLGIGRRLIGFVEYVARERGARLLEVSSGRRAERDAAHRFYPAVGFEDASATAVRYRKELGPPADVRPGNGRPRPCGPA